MHEFWSHISTFFFHFDQLPPELLHAQGPWVYALLFAIIFLESGLVIFAFLPGDSMIFALGALAAQGVFDLGLIFAALSVAAITGGMLNYRIGAMLGRKLVRLQSQKFFSRENYEKAHAFYAHHGAKTIILSWFVSIVRSFAPFIAGMAKMDYKKFTHYNILGAVLWIGSLMGAGYLLGQLHWVKDNFIIVTLLFVIVPALPLAWEFLKPKKLPLKD